MNLEAIVTPIVNFKTNRKMRDDGSIYLAPVNINRPNVRLSGNFDPSYRVKKMEKQMPTSLDNFKLIKSQDINFGENKNLKQFIEELDKSR